MKIGRQNSTTLASREASERMRKSPDILQHGETSTFCKRVLEGENKRERHKVRLQLPEAQRKDFLNKMESLQNLPWLEENSPWWGAQAFLSSFEQIAKTCRWPQEDWAAQLWKALNGEAEWVPTGLATGGDYGEMKAAILQEDVACWQRHCQNFRHFCYQEAEGPRGAYYHLRDLCRGWLRIQKGSKEQILELLILEQFLVILPPEIQDWVRERNPATCSRAVALAEDFLRERQEESLETIESLGSSGGPSRLPEEAPCWGDTKSFLASFEQVAKACRWPKEERAAQLSQVLSGDAKRAFVPLDAREREDYGKMKAAMLQGDALSRKRNHQTFRSFSYKETEGPRRAHWRLRKLGQRWLEPARRTKEQILDLLILEQLLAILPPEIQTWVRGQDPETCSHAVSAAEEFLLKQGEEEEEKEQTVAEEAAPVSLDESPALSDSEQGILKVIIKEEDDNDEDATLLGDLREAEKEEGLAKLSVERTKPLAEEELFGNKCPLCGKDFSCRSDLKRHRRIHTEEKSFRCFECGKSFGRGDYLILHQRLHCGAKPYQCSECGKGFYCSTRLISHRRIHASEKLYKCSGCPKSFCHWARLLQHKRVKHAGARPYKCSECGKSFRRSTHLSQHLRVHANKTAYQCLECGKSFGHGEHLVSHQRRHTREKPFKCLACGKRFKFSGNLNSHLRMHTGEKPFECVQCRKCFSRSAHLILHQRTHIGEKSYD